MASHFTHIHRVVPSIYSFPATAADSSSIMFNLHAEQIRLFLAYDQALRSGVQPPDPPLGYVNFIRIFNDEESVTSRFATATSDGEIHLSGPSPTPYDVLGEDADHQTMREHDGGKWMSDDRLELVEESLWDNMRRNKIAREKRMKAIHERRAKQAMKKSTMPLAYPYPTARPGRKRGTSARTGVAPRAEEDGQLEEGAVAEGSGTHQEGEEGDHEMADEFERVADDENTFTGGGE